MNPITTKMHFTAMLIVAVLFLAMTCISFSLVSCANGDPGDPTSALSQQGDVVKPALFQDFNPGWTNNTSQDGLWTINGVWVGTGKNTFDPANVSFTETYPGEKSKGFMYFTSKANVDQWS